jgi:hypothetical protein
MMEEEPYIHPDALPDLIRVIRRGLRGSQLSKEKKSELRDWCARATKYYKEYRESTDDIPW